MSFPRAVAPTAYGIYSEYATDINGNLIKDAQGKKIISAVKVHFKKDEEEHLIHHSDAENTAHLHRLMTQDVHNKMYDGGAKPIYADIQAFLQNPNNNLTYFDPAAPAFDPMSGPDHNFIRRADKPWHAPLVLPTPKLFTAAAKKAIDQHLFHYAPPERKLEWPDQRPREHERLDQGKIVFSIHHKEETKRAMETKKALQYAPEIGPTRQQIQWAKKRAKEKGMQLPWAKPHAPVSHSPKIKYTPEHELTIAAQESQFHRPESRDFAHKPHPEEEARIAHLRHQNSYDMQSPARAPAYKSTNNGECCLQ